MSLVYSSNQRTKQHLSNQRRSGSKVNKIIGQEIKVRARQLFSRVVMELYTSMFTSYGKTVNTQYCRKVTSSLKEFREEHASPQQCICSHSSGNCFLTFLRSAITTPPQIGIHPKVSFFLIISVPHRLEGCQFLALHDVFLDHRRCPTPFNKGGARRKLSECKRALGVVYCLSETTSQTIARVQCSSCFAMQRPCLGTF